MRIYDIVFGRDSGQVLCTFHDDHNRSAGIGPEGQYNCFACGAKAGSPAGFIANYFSVPFHEAVKINTKINSLSNINFKPKPFTPDQQALIDKYKLDGSLMINSARDKLVYRHLWNGYLVGYTVFNDPSLTNYNAAKAKYDYSYCNIGGMLTPYDTVTRYNRIIVTEGEKDMLTAKAAGVPNVVAKIGGAQTRILGGKDINDKEIILIYDCDNPGRLGMNKDAIYLTNCGCKVKTVDLGLGNGEDLNDYLVKYGKTKADLKALIDQTPIFVVQPEHVRTKMDMLYDSLTANEIKELASIIKEKNNV